jgi:hypothetical protein
LSKKFPGCVAEKAQIFQIRRQESGKDFRKFTQKQGEIMPEQKERRQMLNPRLDANFKAIFTQDTEESRIALRSFLTAAIGLKVEGVTVIKNEEVRQYVVSPGFAKTWILLQNGDKPKEALPKCKKETQHGKYNLCRDGCPQGNIFTLLLRSKDRQVSLRA